jgi:hypothetical protein
MIPRPRRRVHVVLAGVLAAGILITSCSGPSYEYVRNTSLRTAFKVPSDWTLFDKQAFFGLPPGPQASTADPYRWLVAIDADPVPSVSHVLRTDALDTDYPQGIALVQEYSFSERDQASLRSLRDYVFPVTALSQNSNNAQIVTYDETIQETTESEECTSSSSSASARSARSRPRPTPMPASSSGRCSAARGPRCSARAT